MATEMTAQDRLDELTKAADRRKYEAKRNEAGFDLDGDYDTWKVLEELRHLTIAERCAADDTAKPKASATLTINNAFSGSARRGILGRYDGITVG